MSEELRLFRAFGVADAAGEVARPGAVLVRVGSGGGLPELLASGRTEDVEKHARTLGMSEGSPQRIPRSSGARTTSDLKNSVLLPGLVNAHTHLDLTHLGPHPFDPDAGFTAWARMIVNARLRDSDALRASVNDGIARTIAGGVVAVGDIAGVIQTGPIRALQDSGLLGVSFIEYFGVGTRQEEMIARISTLLDRMNVSYESSDDRAHARDERRSAGANPEVRPHDNAHIGLQPHAPYTAGLRLLEWTAQQHHLPLCTHLAETLAEREFISRGTGPFRDFLESMGFWDDSILHEVGQGKTPIEHLAPALRAAPRGWLVAHVNDCNDNDLQLLAETKTSVAYCPRSSAYFRNHHSLGPHRYRDMLHAGINVCLGTDSIVNLPPEEADRISTLDEMRFLFQRDATDPTLLLKMATTNGARALGLDPSLFSLANPSKGARAIAGLIAVDVSGVNASRPMLERAMQSSGPPRVLVTPMGWGED